MKMWTLSNIAWPTSFEFFLRTCSIVVYVLQCIIFDWYLVHYGGSAHAYGWIIADTIVLFSFIFSYIYADLYFNQNRKKPTKPKPKPTDKPEPKPRKATSDEDGGISFSAIDDRNTENTALTINGAPKSGTRPNDQDDDDDNDYQYEPSYKDLFGDDLEEAAFPDEEDQEEAQAENPENPVPADGEEPRAIYYSGRSNSNPEFSSTIAVSAKPTRRLKIVDVKHRYREFQKKAKEREDKILDNLHVGPVRQKYHLGALPLAYISWAMYSVTLIAKVIVIFATFGDDLDSKLLFGTNMLELAFVSTAIVYALIVTSHKRVPRHQKLQKAVIDYMQGRVLMDILDSIELLEFIYEPVEVVDGKEAKLAHPVRNAILTFVSIQLFLPTLGLYELSATNFAQQRDPTSFWNTLQQALNLFLENIPFLVIRIYLWCNNQFTESTFVFIVKNVFEITMNDWDFIVWIKLWIYQKMYHKKKKQKGKPEIKNP